MARGQGCGRGSECNDAPGCAQDKGLVDQTRGILTWVTQNCPDNYHANIGYATVRGPPCFIRPSLCGASSMCHPAISAGPLKGTNVGKLAVRSQDGQICAPACLALPS